MKIWVQMNKKCNYEESRNGDSILDESVWKKSKKNTKRHTINDSNRCNKIEGVDKSNNDRNKEDKRSSKSDNDDNNTKLQSLKSKKRNKQINSTYIERSHDVRNQLFKETETGYRMKTKLSSMMMELAFIIMLLLMKCF